MLMSANSQRGVALLTVLLLVVSITVVAGAMLASQKVAIRRSGVLFDHDQLLQDIHAGQQVAVTRIRADNQLNDTDSLQDIWAQPMQPYMLGAHSVSVVWRDEASRFNINNLYHDGATDTIALAVFQRLLTQLNLEPDIARAVLDWQDPDSKIYVDGGNESTVYSQDNAVNTLPNQPFVSVEQLQEVRGIDAAALAALTPYITAVPYYLPININTASPVLLAALIEDITSEQLTPLTELRTSQALQAVDEIWQLPPFSALSDEPRKALLPLLAIDSGAFMALISVADNSDMQRQRYATVVIRKMAIHDTASTDTAPDKNTVNNIINNTQNSDKSDKQIQVISQRLWAFRPSF